MPHTLEESTKPATYLKVKTFVQTSVNPRTGETVKHNQECVMRPDSVGVLIHRPIDNKFVWVEQPRIGPGTKEPDQPTTIEPVAGMVDKEGDPHEAAWREVLEETGLVPTKLEFISSFYMCPGIMNERMHLYYATIDTMQIAELGGMEEENEFIKIHVWSAEETEAQFKAGRFNTAQSMLLWQWVKLNGLVPELMNTAQPDPAPAL